MEEKEKEKQIQEVKKALYDLRKYYPIADYPLEVKGAIRFYEKKLNKLLKS